MKMKSKSTNKISPMIDNLDKIKNHIDNLIKMTSPIIDTSGYYIACNTFPEITTLEENTGLKIGETYIFIKSSVLQFKDGSNSHSCSSRRTLDNRCVCLYRIDDIILR